MGLQTRWCNACKTTHAGPCPEREAWTKPVIVGSGRGGRRWRRIREQVFERDGYLCQACRGLGIVTVVTLSGSLAGICDHIIPVSEGGSDADHNLQTLCKKCSDVKTVAEAKRGRGRLKP